MSRRPIYHEPVDPRSGLGDRACGHLMRELTRGERARRRGGYWAWGISLTLCGTLWWALNCVLLLGLPWWTYGIVSAVLAGAMMAGFEDIRLRRSALAALLRREQEREE